MKQLKAVRGQEEENRPIKVTSRLGLKDKLAEVGEMEHILDLREAHRRALGKIQQLET